MTASQPWSVKGIDPKAREAAKDLARRSGMTLGEWLNQVILEDGAQDEAPAPPPYTPTFRRAEPPGHSRDEILRVSEALDELTSRIEAAESRTAQVVGGVDQTVSALVARLDEAEREKTVIAARFEGVAEEVRAEQARLAAQLRSEGLSGESTAADAMRTLEGTVAKVAGHLYESEAQTRDALAALRTDLDGVSRLQPAPEDNAALVETMVARIAERLDQAEARTTSAIQGLEVSFGSLDNRLGAAEARLTDQASGGTLEQIAARLSADVEAVRTDMSEKIQATADGRLDRVERALQEMTGHVQVAERRSADALERMGYEVLRLAENLGRQVQDVERRSASAIEQVGGEVARIADTMEARFNHADAVGAQALEKLGAEITRITERLVERIGNAERRSAQAIDDVGDQVARVTERMQDRQERAATDLADRIRQSEERTARLLEDARLRIDLRLEETQRRNREPDAQAPAPQPAAAEDDFSIAPFGHQAFAPEESAFSESAFGRAVFSEPVAEEPAPALQEPEFSIAPFSPSPVSASAYAESEAEPSASDQNETSFGEAAADFVEPALAVASADHAEPAFEAPAFGEREPDLLEPAPMNFVAERFAEPGPMLFRASPIEEPAPFTQARFSEEADDVEDAARTDEAMEPEATAFRAAEPRAFDEDPFEDEPEDEVAFAPSAFTRDHFDTEAREARDAIDEAKAFADAFEEEIPPASPYAFREPVASEHHDEDAFEFQPVEPRFEPTFEETLPFGQAAAEEPAVQHRAMTTRELIEQARAAARAAAEAADPKARKAARKASESPSGLNFGGLTLGLSKKPKRRSNSAIGAALMISGGAAVMGMGAAGYILFAGQPSGGLPTRVMAALGLPSTGAHTHPLASATAAVAPAPDPMAAVALSPQPSEGAVDAPASPTPAAAGGDTGAELYGDAVRRIEARDFTGLDGLRKAANLSYAPAEFYLAKLYETGEAGLKKDLGEARRWTERAADAGDRKAMHNLALYYVEGSGGPKNTTTAAQWFRRAADMGLVDSQYNLGRLYEEGFGVSQNPAEAYKWYLIAAHAGDTESRASAQRLKGQLSSEAQAAAERAAGAFQAQQQSRPTTQLAQAATGSDVAGAAIAQRALSRLGYYQGPTDGSPSPALKLAIEAYQRDQGLPATGVPDTTLSQRLAVIAQ